MLPRLAGANVPNVSGLRVEVGRDVLVALSLCAHPSYLNHVHVRQFGKVSRLAAMMRRTLQLSEGVKDIGLLCHVFQVLDSIVRRIAILVIDVVSVWALPNESQHHKPMNLPSLARFSERNAAIVALSDFQGHQVSLKAAHTSFVADFIHRFVARDGLPLLHLDIVTDYNMAGA